MIDDSESKKLQTAIREFALSTQDTNDWFYIWIIQEKMDRKMTNLADAGMFAKEIALLRSNAKFKSIYEKFKTLYNLCEEAGDPFTFPSKRVEEFERRFHGQA